MEVGDDSLVRDRSTKLPMYARAGVAQYWIVDVRARAIEVYRVPVDEGFSQETKYLDGDELVVELDGAVLGQLRVADLLP